MKIASFNANGIRPRTEIILNWLNKNSPDILCIQETKVQDPDFPSKPFEEAGYRAVYWGQKTYNGMATLSLIEPQNVRFGFGDGLEDNEARIIAAEVNDVVIVNTYVPQGQKPDSEKFRYKLEWFGRLLNYFQKNFSPDMPLIWLGDLNVAPSHLDVYDPERLYGSVCYHPDEHSALTMVMASFGFTDIYRKHKPNEKAYTFWDYRIPNAVKRGLGWRIDHILATRPMAEKSVKSWIDVEPRLSPKPSDHTFLVAEFQEHN